ncbi:ribonucleotide reductase subunit alpha [Stutzerimonas stutzeri TS44]|nr:ribonucleotide reductase subunit alpha [Stutzerimonas stutzeri TS44]
MRHTSLAILAFATLPLGNALADGLVRDLLSSGATTASTYLTFKDDKLILPARADASSFVASAGAIRGPYLEAMLHQLRAEQPQLQASDMELASAILAAEPTH